MWLWRPTKEDCLLLHMRLHLICDTTRVTIIRIAAAEVTSLARSMPTEMQGNKDLPKQCPDRSLPTLRLHRDQIQALQRRMASLLRLRDPPQRLWHVYLRVITSSDCPPLMSRLFCSECQERMPLLLPMTCLLHPQAQMRGAPQAVADQAQDPARELHRMQMAMVPALLGRLILWWHLFASPTEGRWIRSM